MNIITIFIEYLLIFRIIWYLDYKPKQILSIYTNEGTLLLT